MLFPHNFTIEMKLNRRNDRLLLYYFFPLYMFIVLQVILFSVGMYTVVRNIMGRETGGQSVLQSLPVLIMVIEATQAWVLFLVITLTAAKIPTQVRDSVVTGKH